MDLSGLFLSNNDLRVEREQLLDEGRDLSPQIEEAFKKLEPLNMTLDPSFQTRAQALLDLAAGLPQRADYPYVEPSDLEGIRAERPQGTHQVKGTLKEADLHQRLLGAWLGRCCGCLLGKPVEGMRASVLWPYLKELGLYPLRDYLRSDAPVAVVEKYHMPPDAAYVDRVPHMLEDDDLNYTVSGLLILETHGADFTSSDVASFWLANLPILRTWSAERAAYRNLSNLVPPPNSAAYRNPFREWTGARIRADIWGYATPGNPELAAEWAWHDASISHVKNGIYAAMWTAAMLAAAPFARTAREVIEAGLREIPARSRLSESIDEVLGWHDQKLTVEQATEQIQAKWDETWAHHWSHALSNAQIVAVGLLWGEDDFARAIGSAVQTGFHSDSNGATVGSIFGMLHGAEALPRQWTEPLQDTLETGLTGHHRVKISDLAQRTVTLALQLHQSRD